jgi:HK97 family phage major capsid protein
MFNIDNERRKKLNAAAKHYLTRGRLSNAVEHRDLLTDSTGGYIVAQEFNQALAIASKTFGPIYSLVNLRTADSGAPQKVITVDPTVNTFTLVSEGTTSGSGVAQQPSMSSEVVGMDALLSSVIVSRQEIEDSEFDILDWLIKSIGPGVSRSREGSILFGRDSNGDALVNSPSGGLIGSLPALVTQSSGELSAGPTYAQLSALAGSLDRSMYAEGSFLVSPNTEAFLRSQVDSTGRELYSVGDDGFLTIAGRKVFPAVGMANYNAASSVIAAFGAWGRYWSTVSTSVRVKIITNDESPALAINTKELLIYHRIANTPGVASAAGALVSAAS